MKIFFEDDLEKTPTDIIFIHGQAMLA